MRSFYIRRARLAKAHPTLTVCQQSSQIRSPAHPPTHHNPHFHSSTSSQQQQAMAFVPVCVQCGTRSNPCRCKVLGPTLGFVAFVVAGVIEWPLGAAVYLFRHRKGRRIMSHPATVVYPRISSAIPI
ncbi:uncharacterized protein [Setaria viridis]